MATPSNVIRVPKAAKSSYNPNRPLEKNTLLLNQVKHFLELEKQLPLEQQTRIDPASIKTEAHASEYVQKMTAILHPQVSKMGGK
ncbi:MAG TPA: hypothetical protein VEU96_27955 [Bryobacteraceae bacterium]|nr:hypothetical protein [Bryobacteraceae bacterium]